MFEVTTQLVSTTASHHVLPQSIPLIINPGVSKSLTDVNAVPVKTVEYQSRHHDAIPPMKHSYYTAQIDPRTNQVSYHAVPDSTFMYTHKRIGGTKSVRHTSKKLQSAPRIPSHRKKEPTTLLKCNKKERHAGGFLPQLSTSLTSLSNAVDQRSGVSPFQSDERQHTFPAIPTTRNRAGVTSHEPHPLCASPQGDATHDGSYTTGKGVREKREQPFNNPITTRATDAFDGIPSICVQRELERFEVDVLPKCCNSTTTARGGEDFHEQGGLSNIKATATKNPDASSVGETSPACSVPQSQLRRSNRRPKDYSVLHVLFQLGLALRTSICQRLLSIPKVHFGHMLRSIGQHFPSKIHRDDFRRLLADTLRIRPALLDPIEISTVFDLFDARGSGLIEFDELIQGLYAFTDMENAQNALILHWLRGILDKPCPDRVLSAFELNLVQRAVSEHLTLVSQRDARGKTPLRSHTANANGTSPHETYIRLLDEQLWKKVEYWRDSLISAVEFRKLVMEVSAVRAIFQHIFTTLQQQPSQWTATPALLSSMAMTGAATGKEGGSTSARTQQKNVNIFPVEGAATTTKNMADTHSSSLGNSVVPEGGLLALDGASYKGNLSAHITGELGEPLLVDQFCDHDSDRQHEVAEHGNPVYFVLGNMVWRKVYGGEPEAIPMNGNYGSGPHHASHGV